MSRTKLIVALILFLATPGVVRTVFGSEDTSYPENSPSSRSSQESTVLRQVAIALASSREAIHMLHGAPYGDDNRDRLEPSIPGMDCGIDRILSYVTCYSPVIHTKKEAENMFIRLNEDLKAALQSGRWKSVESVPVVGSIRNISYAEIKTGAQIDIELIAEPALDIDAYVISLYGWTGP